MRISPLTDSKYSEMFFFFPVLISKIYVSLNFKISLGNYIYTASVDGRHDSIESGVYGSKARQKIWNSFINLGKKVSGQMLLEFPKE